VLITNNFLEACNVIKGIIKNATITNNHIFLNNNSKPVVHATILENTLISNNVCCGCEPYTTIGGNSVGGSYTSGFVVVDGNCKNTNIKNNLITHAHRDKPVYKFLSNAENLFIDDMVVDFPINTAVVYFAGNDNNNLTNARIKLSLQHDTIDLPEYIPVQANTEIKVFQCDVDIITQCKIKSFSNFATRNMVVDRGVITFGNNGNPYFLYDGNGETTRNINLGKSLDGVIIADLTSGEVYFAFRGSTIKTESISIYNLELKNGCEATTNINGHTYFVKGI
jgi:hypothetical protein